jgi:acetylornithine deacetylase/succinyl-diaminopimelate desuccinylase-like protein
VLFLGISVPSDGWHSVNEKVEIDLLFKGVETAAYLWGELAGDWRAEPWQRTTGK